MQKKDLVMNKYFTIIILLLLSSCCKNGIEISRYVLGDSEKESIPYLADETIKFTHSNGLEFDLSVTNKHTEFQQTEIHHCVDDYSTYETLTVDLFSNIPELYVNIEITPIDFNPFMIISINKYFFELNLSSEPEIDSIIIGGQIFNNIYQADSYMSDSLTISPKQVLYNREVGIIQITMTNNEKITIKK
jgi:hypothetical protein